MQKGLKHTSPEAAERERAHWFGQPGGNPIGDHKAARNQREFYRWCESQATQEDLQAYIQDKSNPYTRRKFVQALIGCETVQDFFELTNQTHGAPKQVIEQTQLPAINIVLE